MQPDRRVMFVRRLFFALLAIVAVASALIAWLNVRGDDDAAATTPHAAPHAAEVERGRYLATAGNCVSCHTQGDGAAMAGGVGIETPFGTVFSSNISPDVATGIGSWSAAEFWRAMHNGRSKNGRLLYPAFPYPNYTLVRREDSDAIYAYLRTLPPVARANASHGLRFPYDTQAALAVWRALFFKPGTFAADAAQSSAWNRGAYLVRGLGHCIACHSNRNAFGATSEKFELSGGRMAAQNWFAPPLNAWNEPGLGDWPPEDIARLLQTGTTARAAVVGPMAEVVYRSTQYLADGDLQAIAAFLKWLPRDHGGATSTSTSASTIPASVVELGQKIYADRCAPCHGDSGAGVAGAYPPLAANRAVTASKLNLMRVVLEGGFPPATAGNPRPYSMPPFGPVLSDAEVAAVLSYVRAAWGNGLDQVSEFEVSRLRDGHS